MSAFRISKPSNKPRKIPVPRGPIDDDLFDAERSDAELEKDETELELERLVFGDDDGFKKELAKHGDAESDAESTEREEEEEEEEDRDLDAVADADLFFFDSQPDITTTSQSLIPPPQSSSAPEADPTPDPGERPAWIDSDDERITVSLASEPRLRKLRRHDGEDLVDGREYTRRLREQFERLYPVPEWADSAAAAAHRAQSKKKKKKKKKRGKEQKKGRRASRGEETLSDSESGAASSSDSDSAMAIATTPSRPLAELLRTAGALTAQPTPSASGRLNLGPDALSIQRTKDIGGTQPSPVTSLTLHPSLPVLLITATPASLLSMHHLSPTSNPPNPLLTTLHLPSFPPSSVHFLPTTTTTPTTTQPSPSPPLLLLSSPRRRYFQTWSLATGALTRSTRALAPATAKHGGAPRSPLAKLRPSPCGRYLAFAAPPAAFGADVSILDAHSSLWLCGTRVEGKHGVADFAWWADGAGLTLVGKSGEVSEYGVAERRVLRRWTDEGGAGATVVALGGAMPPPAPSKKKGTTTTTTTPSCGPDRYLAIGSQSGIVHLYDRARAAFAASARPAPTRAFPHLTTPTSAIVFAPGGGELLIFASRWKRDALRVVHVPSGTVYRNWPTSETPLGRVTALCVGKGVGGGGGGGVGGELGLWVGNEAGRVRAWVIRGN